MKTHAEQLGAECVKAAKDKWGHGWNRLGRELQRAAVCEVVVSMALMVTDGKENKALQHVQNFARAALNTVDPP